MSKHKTIEDIRLPNISLPDENPSLLLPYNGEVLTDNNIVLLFNCFDRTHKYFNLGDNNTDGVVSGNWFIDLLDCLKNISNMTVAQLKQSPYCFHPIDWKKANVSAPKGFDHLEYWQLRINKSRGRIIGFKINNLFYIQWFDPHHNLTDSEGYGTIVKYAMPKSEYEIMVDKIASLSDEVAYWKSEFETADKLLNSIN